MASALSLAAEAGRVGDVPVGAVVLSESGEVIGRGANDREVAGDVLGHAEVVALGAAARHTGSWRLDGATLVVTLEPCPMCCWAAQQARAGPHPPGARPAPPVLSPSSPRAVPAIPACGVRPRIVAP